MSETGGSVRSQIDKNIDNTIEQLHAQQGGFHTFILYTSVVCCVAFAIGLLYIHFIGRRKNRLPDQPHSSATSRFWNELNSSGDRSRDMGTRRVRLLGAEAESLLPQSGRRNNKEGEDEVDSTDSL